MRKNVNNIKKNKKLKVCLQKSCIFFKKPGENLIFERLFYYFSLNLETNYIILERSTNL